MGNLIENGVAYKKWVAVSNYKYSSVLGFGYVDIGGGNGFNKYYFP